MNESQTIYNHSVSIRIVLLSNFLQYRFKFFCSTFSYVVTFQQIHSVPTNLLDKGIMVIPFSAAIMC